MRVGSVGGWRDATVRERVMAGRITRSIGVGFRLQTKFMSLQCSTSLSHAEFFFHAAVVCL